MITRTTRLTLRFAPLRYARRCAARLRRPLAGSLLRCAALRQLTPPCCSLLRPTSTAPCCHILRQQALACAVAPVLPRQAPRLAGDGVAALALLVLAPKLYRNDSEGGHASCCKLRQLYSGDFVSARKRVWPRAGSRGRNAPTHPGCPVCLRYSRSFPGLLRYARLAAGAAIGGCSRQLLCALRVQHSPASLR